MHELFVHVRVNPLILRILKGTFSLYGAHRKALRAYTNGEAPNQFAQPHVGSRSSPLSPYIMCRRTAKILIRCADRSVSLLFTVRIFS